MHRTWPNCIASLMLGGILFVGGCKKKDDPPPLETDPEKLEQIEKELDEAARQESVILKAEKRGNKVDMDE